jgi:hypothetical protein
MKRKRRKQTTKSKPEQAYQKHPHVHQDPYTALHLTWNKSLTEEQGECETS